MKAPILLALSAFFFLAAPFNLAFSGSLATRMQSQETPALLVTSAQCEATCAANRTRCVSGCVPKTDSRVSQCEQGCRFDAGACMHGNCRNTQSSCISDCGRNQAGQTANCEQSCGTAYIYCQRSCASSQAPGVK
jgi:hypothetical protein